MDVGKGCIISDKWIPKGVCTDVEDINGNMLNTMEKVQLNGCTSKYAVVGQSMDGTPMLYFGSDNGSVGWHLTKETVTKHKVKIALV